MHFCKKIAAILSNRGAILQLYNFTNVTVDKALAMFTVWVFNEKPNEKIVIFKIAPLVLQIITMFLQQAVVNQNARNK